MGGKFSRNKGRREEQQLVLALAQLGYKAERILRQYQTAGQPDVKTLEPKQYTFEMKARKQSFITIYDLYYAERDERGIVAFAESSSGRMAAMSTNFKELEAKGYTYRNLFLFPPMPKQIKVYNRILGLKDLKQSADYLVIKDNNKPRLYIEFWG